MHKTQVFLKKLRQRRHILKWLASFFIFFCLKFPQLWCKFGMWCITSHWDNQTPGLLQREKVGNACRKIWIKLLKETNLCVAWYFCTPKGCSLKRKNLLIDCTLEDTLMAKISAHCKRDQIYIRDFNPFARRGAYTNSSYLESPLLPTSLRVLYHLIPTTLLRLFLFIKIIILCVFF